MNALLDTSSEWERSWERKIIQHICFCYCYFIENYTTHLINSIELLFLLLSLSGDMGMRMWKIYGVDNLSKSIFREERRKREDWGRGNPAISLPNGSCCSARMSIYPQTFLIFNRGPPIHQAISYTIYCFLNLSPYISRVSILGIQLTKDHLLIGINRKQSQGNVCVC